MNWLDQIEKLGNRLPDPATLFFLSTIIVMLLSQLAVSFNWTVSSQIIGSLEPRSLLSAEGIWWLLSHMVENFIKFPPLAIVLVGMLGIGLAERSGLLPALLRTIVAHTPKVMLTPTIMFLGIMSSVGLDAGYVVLPPIAAALYIQAGRSPLAGIAIAFAGVSAGFSANLFITAVDPLLGGLTQTAAEIITPDYRVAVTANWWFMMISTLVLTGVGWAVTAWFVEPRLPIDDYQAKNNTELIARLTEQESRGINRAGVALLVTLLLILLCTLIPEAPLYGAGIHFQRWVEAIIPLLLILFFVPGLVYGISTDSIRNDRDVARILGETIAQMGPYIVLAFFAAQFIESFKYSGLGEMLAISGGQMLASANFPAPFLIGGFILMVLCANLVIGSASAKYAFLAPVFVPMLMQVGFSPELTQAAYRVGDSVSNVITPLNPYMIIILVLVQKYMKGSGLGTLIAMMLPYTIVFAIIWTGLLILWQWSGLPLGPGGGLHFNF